MGLEKYAIEIPNMLSLLGNGSTDATIAGLDQVLPSERPPVGKTHFVFGPWSVSGFAMLGIGIWYWFAVLRRGVCLRPGRWLLWRRGRRRLPRLPRNEAGWFVTEWGRQPWLVRGYLRTSEGVTNAWHRVFFVLFTILYIVISVGLVTALIQWPRGGVQGGEGDAAKPTTEGRPDVS